MTDLADTILDLVDSGHRVILDNGTMRVSAARIPSFVPQPYYIVSITMSGTPFSHVQVGGRRFRVLERGAADISLVLDSGDEDMATVVHATGLRAVHDGGVGVGGRPGRVVWSVGGAEAGA